MKNILYLHAGAEMYGADKVLLDLIKNLDRSKFNPIVVLPEDGVLVDAMKKDNINVRVIHYPIMRRKYFNVKGIFKYFSELRKNNKLLFGIIAEEKIDIIHSNTAAVIEGAILSKKFKIPHLWSIHKIIQHPNIMYKVTSKLIAKRSTTVVTDSNAVKNHLKASGYFKNDNIKVIYNGVNSERFNPDVDCSYLYKEWDIPSTAKIIGMMGRVNSWKGQHDFLRAANIIMSKYDDVYTVFVGAAFNGEEWREKELSDEIAKSPYKDRIIMKGYRTDSEAIYKLFDIFVLPSTNPDPLPTVVLESMSTGKPIVGYKHGGVCEMVADGYNGLLAEVKNPEDLAAKIEIILQDEKTRKQMGENSRTRLLENFSIEAYIQNYTEEYERIIN